MREKTETSITLTLLRSGLKVGEPGFAALSQSSHLAVYCANWVDSLMRICWHHDSPALWQRFTSGQGAQRVRFWCRTPGRDRLAQAKIDRKCMGVLERINN